MNEKIFVKKSDLNHIFNRYKTAIHNSSQELENMASNFNSYEYDHMINTSNNLTPTKELAFFNTYNTTYTISYNIQPNSMILSNIAKLDNAYLMYYNYENKLNKLTYPILQGYGLNYDSNNHIVELNIDNNTIKEVNNMLYFNEASLPWATNSIFGVAQLNQKWFDVYNDIVKVNDDRLVDVKNIKNILYNQYNKILGLYNYLYYFYDYENISKSSFVEISSEIDEYGTIINSKIDTKHHHTYFYPNTKIQYTDYYWYYKFKDIPNPEKLIKTKELEYDKTIYCKDLENIQFQITNNNPYYSNYLKYNVAKSEYMSLMFDSIGTVKNEIPNNKEIIDSISYLDIYNITSTEDYSGAEMAAIKYNAQALDNYSGSTMTDAETAQNNSYNPAYWANQYINNTLNGNQSAFYNNIEINPTYTETNIQSLSVNADLLGYDLDYLKNNDLDIYNWNIVCFNGFITIDESDYSTLHKNVSILEPNEKILKDDVIEEYAENLNTNIYITTIDDKYIAVYKDEKTGKYYSSWNNSGYWNDEDNNCLLNKVLFSDISLDLTYGIDGEEDYILDWKTLKSKRETYIYRNDQLININNLFVDSTKFIQKTLFEKNGNLKLSPNKMYFCSSISDYLPYEQKDEVYQFSTIDLEDPFAVINGSSSIKPIFNNFVIDGQNSILLCRTNSSGIQQYKNQLDNKNNYYDSNSNAILFKFGNTEKGSSNFIVRNIKLYTLKDKDDGCAANENNYERYSSSGSRLNAIKITGKNVDIYNVEIHNFKTGINIGYTSNSNDKQSDIRISKTIIDNVEGNSITTNRVFINNCQYIQAPNIGNWINLLYLSPVSNDIFISNSSFVCSDGRSNALIATNSNSNLQNTSIKNIYFINCNLLGSLIYYGCEHSKGTQWLHFIKCTLGQTFNTYWNINKEETVQWLLNCNHNSLELNECQIVTNFNLECDIVSTKDNSNQIYEFLDNVITISNSYSTTMRIINPNIHGELVSANNTTIPTIWNKYDQPTIFHKYWNGYTIINDNSYVNPILITDLQINNNQQSNQNTYNLEDEDWRDFKELTLHRGDIPVDLNQETFTNIESIENVTQKVLNYSLPHVENFVPNDNNIIVIKTKIGANDDEFIVYLNNLKYKYMLTGEVLGLKPANINLNSYENYYIYGGQTHQVIDLTDEVSEDGLVQKGRYNANKLEQFILKTNDNFVGLKLSDIYYITPYEEQNQSISKYIELTNNFVIDGTLNNVSKGGIITNDKLFNTTYSFELYNAQIRRFKDNGIPNIQIGLNENITTIEQFRVENSTFKLLPNTYCNKKPYASSNYFKLIVPTTSTPLVNDNNKDTKKLDDATPHFEHIYFNNNTIYGNDIIVAPLLHVTKSCRITNNKVDHCEGIGFNLSLTNNNDNNFYPGFFSCPIYFIRNTIVGKHEVLRKRDLTQSNIYTPLLANNASIYMANNVIKNFMCGKSYFIYSDVPSTTDQKTYRVLMKSNAINNYEVYDAYLGAVQLYMFNNTVTNLLNFDYKDNYNAEILRRKQTHISNYFKNELNNGLFTTKHANVIQYYKYNTLKINTSDSVFKETVGKLNLIDVSSTNSKVYYMFDISSNLNNCKALNCIVNSTFDEVAQEIVNKYNENNNGNLATNINDVITNYDNSNPIKGILNTFKALSNSTDTVLEANMFNINAQNQNDCLTSLHLFKAQFGGVINNMPFAVKRFIYSNNTIDMGNYGSIVGCAFVDGTGGIEQFECENNIFKARFIVQNPFNSDAHYLNDADNYINFYNAQHSNIANYDNALFIFYTNMEYYANNVDKDSSYIKVMNNQFYMDLFDSYDGDTAKIQFLMTKFLYNPNGSTTNEKYGTKAYVDNIANFLCSDYGIAGRLVVEDNYVNGIKQVGTNAGQGIAAGTVNQTPYPHNSLIQIYKCRVNNDETEKVFMEYIYRYYDQNGDLINSKSNIITYDEVKNRLSQQQENNNNNNQNNPSPSELTQYNYFEQNNISNEANIIDADNNVNETALYTEIKNIPNIDYNNERLYPEYWADLDGSFTYGSEDYSLWPLLCFNGNVSIQSNNLENNFDELIFAPSERIIHRYDYMPHFRDAHSIYYNEATQSFVLGHNETQGYADGNNTYIWIKFCEVFPTNNNAIFKEKLYDKPTSKTKYIGIATNKSSQISSDLFTDYDWFEVSGSQKYTWVKFANDSNGTNASFIPSSDKLWFAFAYNRDYAKDDGNVSNNTNYSINTNVWGTYKDSLKTQTYGSETLANSVLGYTESYYDSSLGQTIVNNYYNAIKYADKCPTSDSDMYDEYNSSTTKWIGFLLLQGNVDSQNGLGVKSKLARPYCKSDWFGAYTWQQFNNFTHIVFEDSNGNKSYTPSQNTTKVYLKLNQNDPQIYNDSIDVTDWICCTLNDTQMKYYKEWGIGTTLSNQYWCDWKVDTNIIKDNYYKDSTVYNDSITGKARTDTLYSNIKFVNNIDYNEELASSYTTIRKTYKFKNNSLIEYLSDDGMGDPEFDWSKYIYKCLKENNGIMLLNPNNIYICKNMDNWNLEQNTYYTDSTNPLMGKSNFIIDGQNSVLYCTSQHNANIHGNKGSGRNQENKRIFGLYNNFNGIIKNLKIHTICDKDSGSTENHYRFSSSSSGLCAFESISKETDNRDIDVSNILFDNVEITNSIGFNIRHGFKIFLNNIKNTHTDTTNLYGNSISIYNSSFSQNGFVGDGMNTISGGPDNVHLGFKAYNSFFYTEAPFASITINMDQNNNYISEYHNCVFMSSNILNGSNNQWQRYYNCRFYQLFSQNIISNTYERINYKCSGDELYLGNVSKSHQLFDSCDFDLTTMLMLLWEADAMPYYWLIMKNCIVNKSSNINSSTKLFSGNPNAIGYGNTFNIPNGITLGNNLESKLNSTTELNNYAIIDNEYLSTIYNKYITNLLTRINFVDMLNNASASTTKGQQILAVYKWFCSTYTITASVIQSFVELENDENYINLFASNSSSKDIKLIQFMNSLKSALNNVDVYYNWFIGRSCENTNTLFVYKEILALYNKNVSSSYDMSTNNGVINNTTNQQQGSQTINTGVVSGGITFSASSEPIEQGIRTNDLSKLINGNSNNNSGQISSGISSTISTSSISITGNSNSGSSITPPSMTKTSINSNIILDIPSSSNYSSADYAIPINIENSEQRIFNTELGSLTIEQAELRSTGVFPIDISDVNFYETNTEYPLCDSYDYETFNKYWEWPIVCFNGFVTKEDIKNEAKSFTETSTYSIEGVDDHAPYAIFSPNDRIEKKYENMPNFYDSTSIVYYIDGHCFLLKTYNKTTNKFRYFKSIDFNKNYYSNNILYKWKYDEDIIKHYYGTMKNYNTYYEKEDQNDAYMSSVLMPKKQTLYSDISIDPTTNLPKRETYVLMEVDGTNKNHIYPFKIDITNPSTSTTITKNYAFVKLSTLFSDSTKAIYECLNRNNGIVKFRPNRVYVAYCDYIDTSSNKSNNPLYKKKQIVINGQNTHLFLLSKNNINGQKFSNLPYLFNIDNSQNITIKDFNVYSIRDKDVDYTVVDDKNSFSTSNSGTIFVRFGANVENAKITNIQSMNCNTFYFNSCKNVFIDNWKADNETQFTCNGYSLYLSDCILGQYPIASYDTNLINGNIYLLDLYNCVLNSYGPFVSSLIKLNNNKSKVFRARLSKFYGYNIIESINKGLLWKTFYICELHQRFHTLLNIENGLATFGPYVRYLDTSYQSSSLYQNSKIYLDSIGWIVWGDNNVNSYGLAAENTILYVDSYYNGGIKPSAPISNPYIEFIEEDKSEFPSHIKGEKQHYILSDGKLEATAETTGINTQNGTNTNIQNGTNTNTAVISGGVILGAGEFTPINNNQNAAIVAQSIEVPEYVWSGNPFMTLSRNNVIYNVENFEGGLFFNNDAIIDEYENCYHLAYALLNDNKTVYTDTQQIELIYFYGILNIGKQYYETQRISPKIDITDGFSNFELMNKYQNNDFGRIDFELNKDKVVDNFLFKFDLSYFGNNDLYKAELDANKTTVNSFYTYMYEDQTNEYNKFIVKVNNYSAKTKYNMNEDMHYATSYSSLQYINKTIDKILYNNYGLMMNLKYNVPNISYIYKEINMSSLENTISSEYITINNDIELMNQDNRPIKLIYDFRNIEYLSSNEVEMQTSNNEFTYYNVLVDENTLNSLREEDVSNLIIPTTTFNFLYDNNIIFDANNSYILLGYNVDNMNENQFRKIYYSIFEDCSTYFISNKYALIDNNILYSKNYIFNLNNILFDDSHTTQSIYALQITKDNHNNYVIKETPNTIGSLVTNIDAMKINI